MRQNVDIKNRKEELKGRRGKTHSDGYPLYPEADDIYNKFHEEADLDPEDISREIDSVATDINSGGNLDVPGSEFDDNREDIGNEDEENNYYSIGGDAHNNLDEN